MRYELRYSATRGRTRALGSGPSECSTGEDAGSESRGNELWNRCRKYERLAARRLSHIETLQAKLTEKNGEIDDLRAQVSRLFDQKEQLLRVINQGVFPVRPFAQTPTCKEQALKPLEEAAEAFGAWQLLQNAETVSETLTEDARRRVVEECADTIQAAVNLAASMGCRDMTKPMLECWRRNHARSRC